MHKINVIPPAEPARAARRLIGTLLIGALLPGAAAQGQYLDGRGLLSLCARHEVEDPGLTEAQVVQDVAATGTCRGYLMGVADRLEEDPAAPVCLPAETTVGNLLALVRGYAARHPDALGRPASRLVASALGQAHPCPGTTRKGGGR